MQSSWLDELREFFFGFLRAHLRVCLHDDLSGLMRNNIIYTFYTCDAFLEDVQVRAPSVSEYKPQVYPHGQVYVSSRKLCDALTAAYEERLYRDDLAVNRALECHRCYGYDRVLSSAHIRPCMDSSATLIDLGDQSCVYCRYAVSWLA